MERNIELKVNIAKMKADIKTKVEEQKFLKIQRKTVLIKETYNKVTNMHNLHKVERKVDPKTACYRHRNNREDLRILYAAYGIARGKTFSQIENHYPEENHPLMTHQKRIDRILESYKHLVEVPVME